MFKALTLGVLVASALGLRMDSSHSQGEVWTTSEQLTEKQRQWDDFFRDEIDALGDSEVKKVSGDNYIEYLDTTNDDNEDEIVAWQVQGAVDDSDNWYIQRIVQVKTYPDEDDENISYVEKTTYETNNLPAIASREYQ